MRRKNPIIFKFSSDMIPIVLLSVQANESMPALYKILDDNVASPLARISGVGSVSISGAPEREIQVYVDPVKLEAYNLSIEAISSVIGAENRNIPEVRLRSVRKLIHCVCKGSLATPRK